MAFSGDLEHLSIVDVIQLLHSTRKTGTLKVQGRKGEISVAFNDGYMVGASHYEKGTRIGTILTEAGVISNETLQKALAIQTKSGDARKPLIATLLENSLVDNNAAYRALEALIELSIVEILTWKKGSFALHVNEILICDEFRYFPENLSENITLPTEHVLMDALRLFDEKMRDGLLQMEEDLVEPAPVTEPSPVKEELFTLSADDLGLGELDTVKRKLPAFHEALKDNDLSTEMLPPPSSFNQILKDTTINLQKAATLPETALILLETVAALFPRALTLVVWNNELVAERGIGITTSHEAGPGPVMGFKIPLSSGTLFRFILDKGYLFYGKSSDEALHQHLYPVIDAPVEPTILLLPLKLGKRVVSLIYADFGNQQAADIPTAQLEGCAEHAGMVIESALLRKQQTANSNLQSR